MKSQDIIFLVLIAIVLFVRKSLLSVSIGLFMVVLAIPLFERHIFFTAERLTYYAIGFFVLGIFLSLIELAKDKE